ncbi:P-loop containing nucleoside triphosphate hydrolase protein, partial [Dissophora ornata]
MLPRSDPSNDFAEDIFRSPESSAHPAQPPTHHLIDQQAVQTWQYPINYPKRDYQFNIIRRALFTNTLVSLPTGLGKTFIAAVVMLNYFRWFPKSKIIFMAPTRPLVNQQIEACFNICGIPQDETVELTGQQNAELRKEMWAERRVIFCTPQVLQNDLKSEICEARDIVCLVIDEAHRATGRYAYSEVVRLLDPLNRDVRVMALTATPGGDMKTVQQVVQNLKIAKIEMRTEDSMDLQKYVFKRTIQEMVVPCGREVGEIRDKFHRMMRPFLDRLTKQNILRTADPGQLSRFALLQGRDACLRERSLDGGTKAFIMKQVTICIGLVHAYELLTVHGIRPFFANMDPFAGSSINTMNARAPSSGSKRKNFDEDFDRDDDNKPSMARKAMEEIPDFMRMMDGIRAKMKQPNFMSHPKLERLVGVVVEHFVSHQDESDALVQARANSAASSSTATTSDGPLPQTRVMIFANYRESVEEIIRVLDQHRPLVKVQSFIGQATAKGKKGISQKEQQKVVADFQKGEHNVLVATSIGEEGLDIGDVDLIICYDSHSSPIRMLQRMGRTGRKRKGKICLLLAEGQEEQKYRRSQTSYKNVQRSIAQGNNITYYPNSPRILPPGPAPKCEEVHLHVP